MHTEPYQLVADLKKTFPEYFTGKKVLEVGSLNINGTVRDFFHTCEYTGIDLDKGKGVDVICPAHLYIHPEEFDVVISTEMLEHDQYWKLSLAQMYANLKIGGILIFSCAGPDRQEHGTTRTHPGDSPYTNNYYRNISIEDFESILPAELFSQSKIYYLRGKADLLFWGIKS
jgi:hypothetical protein